MSTKILVKNLSGSVCIGALHELFAEHGGVESVKLVRRASSGQCLGYVQMPDAVAAAAAVTALHGSSSDGLVISVREMQRPLMRRERPYSGNGRSRGSSGRFGGQDTSTLGPDGV